MLMVGRLLRNLLAHAHSACGWISYRLGLRHAAQRHFERVLLLRGTDFRAYVHLGRIAFDSGDYASWRREFEHARRADPVRFARLQHPLERAVPRLAGTRFLAAPHGDGFDGTGARATWRALRPFRANSSSGSAQAGDRRRDPTADQALSRDDGRTDPWFDWSDPQAGERSAEDHVRQDVAGPDRAVGNGDRARATGGRYGDDQADDRIPHDDCSTAAERRHFRSRGPIGAAEIAGCDVDELLRRLSG